jgi:ABC-type transporter Mla subunit MlaD
MNIEDRLQRLDMRQEALVSAISGLTDVMEQTRDLVVELMAWLQEPPSSELPDAIKAMAQEIKGLADVVHAHGASKTP